MLKNGDKIKALIKPIFKNESEKEIVKGKYLFFEGRHLILYSNMVSQFELKNLIKKYD